MLTLDKTRKSSSIFNTVEEAIEDIKLGRFVVVADDEDRENEGDLIIAAEFADAAAINFMITQGKGLVCVTITPEMAERLNLHPMVQVNGDPHGTAFTISIDAAPQFGVTTGISASDRATTVQLMLDPNSQPSWFRRPGHLFPLIAKKGGVVERQGHTEASVELARLAGLAPASVIVEIIKEDGEMARQPDLVKFARANGLKFITIEALREYVLNNSK
jgi:3,4-dihydroxy 2-butanone 4-phosphate synthase/GTP cyclohydrolase II